MGVLLLLLLLLLLLSRRSCHDNAVGVGVICGSGVGGSGVGGSAGSGDTGAVDNPNPVAGVHGHLLYVLDSVLASLLSLSLFFSGFGLYTYCYAWFLLPSVVLSNAHRVRVVSCVCCVGSRVERSGVSGVQWTGLDWSGVEWSGVEWSGVEWSGVEWSGVEWSGVEWSGVECNDGCRAGCNGEVLSGCRRSIRQGEQ